MRFIGRDEFAAQRRGALERGDRDLAPAVDEALAHWGEDRWFTPILDAARDLFLLTAETEGANEAVSD